MNQNRIESLRKLVRSVHKEIPRNKSSPTIRVPVERVLSAYVVCRQGRDRFVRSSVICLLHTDSGTMCIRRKRGYVQLVLTYGDIYMRFGNTTLGSQLIRG